MRLSYNGQYEHTQLHMMKGECWKEKKKAIERARARERLRERERESARERASARERERERAGEREGEGERGQQEQESPCVCVWNDTECCPCE